MNSTPERERSHNYSDPIATPLSLSAFSVSPVFISFPLSQIYLNLLLYFFLVRFFAHVVLSPSFFSLSFSFLFFPFLNIYSRSFESIGIRCGGRRCNRRWRAPVGRTPGHSQRAMPEHFRFPHQKEDYQEGHGPSP